MAFSGLRTAGQKAVITATRNRDFDKVLKLKREFQEALGIPENAKEFGGHSYASGVFPTRQETLDWCAQHNGRLVSIETQAEIVFINKTFGPNLQEDWKCRIGLVKVDNRWMWQSGVPVMVNGWNLGKPDNSANYGMLWRFRGRFGWIDFESDEHRYGFICEWSF